jgi:hypothetical protein
MNNLILLGQLQQFIQLMKFIQVQALKNVELQNKTKFLMPAMDLNKEKVGALFLMKFVNGIIMII